MEIRHGVGDQKYITLKVIDDIPSSIETPIEKTLSSHCPSSKGTQNGTRVCTNGRPCHVGNGGRPQSYCIQQANVDDISILYVRFV